MTLCEAEARESILMGFDELALAGLPRPDTFCAPGWLLTDGARQGVADAGIRLLAGMFSIQDLQARRSQLVPSLGYMGGGRIHALGIGAMSSLVAPIAPRFSATKIYLHPDPSGRRRWRPAIQRAKTMVEHGWQPVTFDDLFK